MKSHNPDVNSIVIPIFNEEENIRDTVVEAASVLSKLDHPWNILVVNDGSSDRTGLIANELSEENPRIRVVNHHGNRGYAIATRTALTSATGDVIFIIGSCVYNSS